MTSLLENTFMSLNPSWRIWHFLWKWSNEAPVLVFWPDKNGHSALVSCLKSWKASQGVLPFSRGEIPKGYEVSPMLTKQFFSLLEFSGLFVWKAYISFLREIKVRHGHGVLVITQLSNLWTSNDECCRIFMFTH